LAFVVTYRFFVVYSFVILQHLGKAWRERNASVQSNIVKVKHMDVRLIYCFEAEVRMASAAGLTIDIETVMTS
jgi:hypothetical protein